MRRGSFVPPERIFRTFVFELAPEHEAFETMTFTTQGRGTLISTLTIHKTVEARDGHLANGAMEQGMTEGYDRMDELVANLMGTRS